MFAEDRKQVQLFPCPYTQEYSPAAYAPQVGLWIDSCFMLRASEERPQALPDCQRTLADLKPSSNSETNQKHHS
jgi:hypothetical protein